MSNECNADRSRDRDGTCTRTPVGDLPYCVDHLHLLANDSDA